MEFFNSITGVLLTTAAIFGLGWAVHAFFHRREHVSLKANVLELKKELEEAKQDQKVTVNIKPVTPASLESLELTEDECNLLVQIAEESDCGPTKGMSWNRTTLAGQRLHEKGLIEEDQDGTHPSRLALEWLEKNNRLK